MENTENSEKESKTNEDAKKVANEVANEIANEAANETANVITKETENVATIATKDTNDTSTPGETTQEPSAELLEKIQEQVEYYFGDANMQRDKFLIEQTKLDEGWVPMTIMLNFKQLANLSKDVNVILKALENSDLMEISEDRKKIRRSPKHPLPEYNEEYRKSQTARTVYVKAFPQTYTIDNLKEFFAKYRPFETILMRKYQDKDKSFKFKGSVYVLFRTVESAKAFMDLESVKHDDKELIRRWAADFLEEKAQKYKKRNADKESKKSVTEIENEEMNQAPPTTEVKLPRGSVIHFTGVSKICTREDVKSRLEELDADIAYIDFQRGNSEGWVRLVGENAAKPLLEKMDEGKVIINDEDVTCRILEGEEEQKYLVKVTEEMMAAKNKHNKAKRGGKKGRNARSGKKRSGSPARDTTPSKKVKNAE